MSKRYEYDAGLVRSADKLTAIISDRAYNGWRLHTLIHIAEDQFYAVFEREWRQPL